ncbi:hypothetical protein ACI2LO_32695 [Streptomyces sp. NPDC033754]|uniref:hypothetical protein n=1 Tax=unclassified Streptomyces TaxID=2593676 RepID=UPI00340EFED9
MPGWGRGGHVTGVLAAGLLLVGLLPQQAARKEVSTGWGIVRTMAGVGDLTGDGLPDVLAVWEDGTARLYPGRLDGLGAAAPVDLGWGAR